MFVRFVSVVLVALCLFTALAQEKSPEQLAREEAIAEFTKKQQAANWPEKFGRIGNEMGVPPDVLAAVAFAETRWEHLTWPPGETVSPENGRPRGYGIMFLQDNDHFGHSLEEAAKLIGKAPAELKVDPELNIRGAAALLKKLYDENPKPDFAKPQDVESWYNAIIKYCGIPQPYLSHHHALNCYVYMSKGYDQYGMHWTPQRVNLVPMEADVRKLRQEFDAAIRPSNETNSNTIQPPPTNTVTEMRRRTSTVAEHEQTRPIAEIDVGSKLRWWGLGIVVFLIVAVLFGRRKRGDRVR
jgi:hypothetical protein